MSTEPSLTAEMSLTAPRALLSPLPSRLFVQPCRSALLPLRRASLLCAAPLRREMLPARPGVAARGRRRLPRRRRPPDGGAWPGGTERPPADAGACINRPSPARGRGWERNRGPSACHAGCWGDEISDGGEGQAGSSRSTPAAEDSESNRSNVFAPGSGHNRTGCDCVPRNAR